MTIFNIISCALISAAIGGRFGNHSIFKPRTIAIGAFIGLVAGQPNATYGYIIAWLYAFTIIRLLPTGGLFQAIHGEKPKFDDGIICAITNDIYFAVKIVSWKLWGIIYGFVRTLPVIPAAIYLGEPVLYLAPLIGVVYWFSGQMLGNTTKAVAVAEIVVGGMIGAAV